MNLQNEKQRIIQQIDQIQNLSILKKIQEVLSEEQENELSIIEQKLIEKGRNDFQNNSFSTNEEVKKRIKTRFNFS